MRREVRGGELNKSPRRPNRHPSKRRDQLLDRFLLPSNVQPRQQAPHTSQCRRRFPWYGWVLRQQDTLGFGSITLLPRCKPSNERRNERRSYVFFNNRTSPASYPKNSSRHNGKCTPHNHTTKNQHSNHHLSDNYNSQRTLCCFYSCFLEALLHL